MRTPDALRLFCCIVMSVAVAPALADGPALGRPADAAVIRMMDLTILPDGKDLPPGRGTVAEGRRVYEAKCLACHGVGGQGQPMDRLTGGIGSLASPAPVKTVNSYWPYATSLFDYVRRAMPLTAPQTLRADEVYALVAYILSVDGVVKPDAVLDAKSLPAVKMPNRDGFLDWWENPRR
jgi:S-disulfanyl-L-cysteine oxidoreductase SoxD